MRRILLLGLLGLQAQQSRALRYPSLDEAYKGHGIGRKDRKILREAELALETGNRFDKRYKDLQKEIGPLKAKQELCADPFICAVNPFTQQDEQLLKDLEADASST